MDDKSSAKILVLGSYNVDLTSLVTKFPKPGETITGLSFQQGPGGKGSNQAIAAARLDGQVSFMCCLGDDSFASEALEMFTKEKMDLNI